MTAPEPVRPPWLRCRDFLLDQIPTGATVLDVGCGDGDLLRELTARGYSASGIEVVPALVAAASNAGLSVTLGRAEALPLADASVDAVVCSVVLPYTNERLAVSEWARVLRPGGMVNLTCHGWGYGFNYLLRGQSLKMRFYGLRMIVNSSFYSLTRRRLPGKFGDTLCQSRRRLRAYYTANRFTLESEEIVDSCLGLPRFLCHRLRKP